jgi:hypothetical protein
MRTKAALRLLLALAAAPAAPPAGADFSAYDGVKNLEASGGNTRAEHHHDWRKHKAHVRVLDAASGQKLLERPSPALTTLWVSPDGRYVVGLSTIKSANPKQLLVLSRDGAYLREEGVLCADPRLRGHHCTESVSNVVLWYDQEKPEIDLAVKDGQPVALSVNEARDWACARPKREGMDPAEWQRLCPEPRRRLRLPLAE